VNAFEALRAHGLGFPEAIEDEQVAMAPGHGCGLPGAIHTCSSHGVTPR
jgi:hypothetical protein